ncbi:lysozyme [Pseudomonas laurylsulfatiphila]|uniref:lysozyme n=1 Tax=Pseudomonas laurylsulfatiphila TaxID=2011015 RepID=UPI003D2464C2
MKTSKEGLEELQSSESCKLKAYPDPLSPLAIAKRAKQPTEGLSGAPWTIGWGQTGEGIKEGVEWTQEQADAARDATVAAREKAITKALTRAATQAQFDAMISLSYNIGVRAFQNSTVLRQHNAGNFKDAANAFLMWNKKTIDGVLTYNEGLNSRRQREKALYLTIQTPKAA